MPGGPAPAATPAVDDPASADPALLGVSDLCVRFGGVVALDGVSFGVRAGHIVGLIGPNGAGKTTLFNCLSRLYRCDRGSVVFAGQPLLRVAAHRVAALGIGRTFQNLALFGSMSVLDNVMAGRHCRTRSGFLANALRLPGAVGEHEETRRRAEALLQMLDLDGVAHANVAGLPFATKKRVEIARALAGEPRLLLLDEPAGGLNHEEVDALGRLIVEIRDRLGVTILLVEHHMRLVMGISDRVIALNFGRKIAEGPPQAVSVHPQVVEAYLGAPA